MLFLWSVRSVEHADRGRTLTRERMPADVQTRLTIEDSTILLQRLQSISLSLRNHQTNRKKNVWSAICIYFGKKQHPKNNKLDRKHPKNTIKKPRKTHPFPQSHAQKTREVSATFLHSKLVRSERVKSTTPKSFLVHYCRKEWSEPVKLC